MDCLKGKGTHMLDGGVFSFSNTFLVCFFDFGVSVESDCVRCGFCGGF